MVCLETDRKAARRCLRDASTLLGADTQDLGVHAPGVDNLRPGGLAAWQARRTLAYIEANLTSKMNIDDLANVVSLSGSHFSRAFKRSLGFSPMEYVVLRRVERAKAMISGTGQPLAEVALACGFADQPHLNRRFLDIVGVSPGRWRRSNFPAAMPGVAEARNCNPRPALWLAAVGATGDQPFHTEPASILKVARERLSSS